MAETFGWQRDIGLRRCFEWRDIFGGGVIIGDENFFGGREILGCGHMLASGDSGGSGGGNNVNI